MDTVFKRLFSRFFMKYLKEYIKLLEISCNIRNLKKYLEILRNIAENIDLLRLKNFLTIKPTWLNFFFNYFNVWSTSDPHKQSNEFHQAHP